MNQRDFKYGVTLAFLRAPADFFEGALVHTKAGI